MSLDQIIAAFDSLLGNFDPIMTEEVTTIANDGLDIVDRRITRQGLNASGSPLPDYSPGYKLYKKREGKYRGIVDLTFTGNMWKNTGIVSTVDQGGVVTVTVAGKDQFTRDKMVNNADLRGDFLTLSPKEIEQLKDDSKERLFGKINGYFE